MNDDQEPKGNPLLRNMAIWSAIIVALLLLASMFSGTTETAKGISYSAFREKVEAGEVKSVAIAPGQSAPDEIRDWFSGDYVVRYLILDNRIVILRVWHGKEGRG